MKLINKFVSSPLLHNRPRPILCYSNWFLVNSFGSTYFEICWNWTIFSHIANICLHRNSNLSWIEPQNPQTHIHKQCNTVPFCTNFQLHTNRIEKSRNGCATSEDLFWKLDALQSFIRDLHWPDAEFRQHLEQRLKLMACDMIESCLQRTEQSFQQWLKKSVTFISTDYIISTEMCAMVNVILDAKNQSFKLCSVDGIDVVSYCFESADL